MAMGMLANESLTCYWINIMSKYKNLALNAVLFAVNAFATKFVVFLLVPLYTYFMTTEEYGITDMSLTVISLVTPLATLSMADAAVRFIVGDRDRESNYATVAFVITCVSVAFVALLTPALDLPVFGGLGAYKVEFVLAYASSAFLQLCSEVARGRGEVKLIPVCAAVSSLATCVCAGVLIGLFGLAIEGYFISVTVGPVLAVAVYLIAGGLGSLFASGFRSMVYGSGLSDRLKSIVTPMLKYSLPLIPNSLFWWVGTSINRFFITGMLGIGASGLFAAAGKVPGLVNTAYTVFQQAWQLSAFQEAKEEGLERFFSQVFLALQVLMLVLCSALSLLAPTVASLFLQGEFYNAWPLMPVLLLANLLNVFNAFFGTVYTTTMHTGYIMKTTVYGAIACVVLTPLLIMPLGVSGACIASCAGNALVLLMRAIDSRRFLKVDAGWSFLLLCLALIAFQAVLAISQIPYWQMLSTLVFVVISVIQVVRVMSLISTLKKQN